VTDGLATSRASGAPDPVDPLEERLASALPRLRAHVARSSRRVPGVDPDDVAQEVVARALRYRATYDARRELWPWLRRVAEHVLIRQRAAGSRHPQPLAEHEPAAPEPVLEGESREEVARLLAGLKPIERDVLVRFHVRLESVREIARALGLREGTVKSHLSRARRRVAELPEPGDTP